MRPNLRSSSLEPSSAGSFLHEGTVSAAGFSARQALATSAAPSPCARHGADPGVSLLRPPPTEDHQATRDLPTSLHAASILAQRTGAPIALEEIRIIAKKSRHTLELERSGLSHLELMARYEERKEDVAALLGSHQRQEESLHALRKIFGPTQFIERDELTPESLRGAKAVIALGGDNHFQYVSHHVTDQLLIGVNSDPVLSTGAQVLFRAHELPEIIAKLASGRYEVEEWTRLRVQIDREEFPPILDQLYLGESDPVEMSHYVVKLKGDQEVQKSSGIMVATGAGSTGWYDAALHGPSDVFQKTKKEAHFVARECPRLGRIPYRMKQGVLTNLDELTILSKNDEGVARADSLERLPFRRGAVAHITIHPQSARVLSRSCVES